jgi:hypothetical protein
MVKPYICCPELVPQNADVLGVRIERSSTHADEMLEDPRSQ